MLVSRLLAILTQAAHYDWCVTEFIRGRKAFTLQTLLSSGDNERSATRAKGFSPHVGVIAAADQRDKLERLRRYITRPAVSTE